MPEYNYRCCVRRCRRLHGAARPYKYIIFARFVLYARRALFPYAVFGTALRTIKFFLLGIAERRVSSSARARTRERVRDETGSCNSAYEFSPE